MPIDPNLLNKTRQDLQKRRPVFNPRATLPQQEEEPAWWERALGTVAETPVVGDVLEGIGTVTEPIFNVVDYPWKEWALPVLTAPFTPETEDTEGMSWWDRERQEYKDWDSPKYVKGALELANPIYYPGLVLSGGAGAMAKVPQLTGVAAKTAKVGKAVSAVEALPLKLAGKGIKAGVKPIGAGIGAGTKAAEGALEKATGKSFALPERQLPKITKKVVNSEYNIIRKLEKGEVLDYKKPHGLYFTVGKVSPHADIGIGEVKALMTGSKVLEVPQETIKHLRFGILGEGEVSAGVSALKKLTSEQEFNRLIKLDKNSLIKELNYKYPGYDYSKYYDSYELLEAYGGQLARSDGYDAILLIDKKLPEFSEYVALNKQAIRELGEETVEVPLTGLNKLQVATELSRKQRPAVKEAIKAEARAYRSQAQKFYDDLISKGTPTEEALNKTKAYYKDLLPDIEIEGVTKKGFLATHTKLELTPEQEIAIKMTDQEARDIVEYLGKYKPVKKGQFWNNDLSVRSFNKLMTSREPLTVAEMRSLELPLGKEFTSAAVNLQKTGRLEKFLDIANMPRAIIASWDFSAPFRQGMILTGRMASKGQFREIGHSFKDMFKSFALEKNAILKDDAIKSGKWFQERMANGGYHAPLDGALNKSEEAFMSKFARNIPGIRRSERAYATYLNSIRDSYYNTTRNMWDNMLAKGVITEVTEQDIRGLNKLVNWATGRGSIGALEKGNIGPLMNATLFSPRLLISRLQWPTMMASKSPLVRKEAANQMATFLGLGAGVIGLAIAAGAKVNFDPRSSEFGKIKVGNTRLDIWTGYAQYTRFASQLATNQKLNQLGELSEADRINTIWRFIQSKSSPATGLVVDLLQGESYMGEEMNLESDNLSKQAWNRLMPLFVQDLSEAIKDQGPLGGLIATPGAFGVGVITYSNDELIARQKLTEEFDLTSEDWNDYEVRLARRILKPYYDIREKAWEQYPELEVIADQIQVLKKTNPQIAVQVQRRYPQILRIEEAIIDARTKMLQTNPQIRDAYKLVNK